MRPWYYSVTNFQDFWTVGVQVNGTLNTRAYITVDAGRVPQNLECGRRCKLSPQMLSCFKISSTSARRGQGQKIPLRIHKNTPFQEKKFSLFLWSGPSGPFPYTKTSLRHLNRSSCCPWPWPSLRSNPHSRRNIILVNFSCTIVVGYANEINLNNRIGFKFLLIVFRRWTVYQHVTLLPAQRLKRPCFQMFYYAVNSLPSWQIIMEHN